jgi:hypothetical protein
VPPLIGGLFTFAELQANTMKHAFKRRFVRYDHLALLAVALCVPGILRVGSANADGDSTSQVSNPDARPAAVRAASSAVFLSSLGVNTHVDQGYNPAPYVAMLQYTGIRNIRDGFRNTPRFVMLHEQAGIHVDLGGPDISGLTTAAKTLAAAGALLSVEGPNEPNNFPITYHGQREAVGRAGFPWLSSRRISTAR